MKEKLLNYMIFLIAANALLQLALSQIHIKTITKVFATEIGFFLFLYIIFGLVTLFNLTSIKKSGNDILFVLGSVIVVGVGIKYSQLLINDSKIQESVTYNDIYLSLYMVIIGMIIYGLGTAIVMITKKSLDEKEG